MTISLKADPSGTFGEVLVNGSPALKVSNGLLELADGKDFFNQGNILGTVSQLAGVPTGAVVERGSNANGEYVRFADGTQICTGQLTGPYAAGVNSLIAVPWTFPAAFSSSDYAISSYGAPAATNDLFGMVAYANNTPSSIIANYRNGSTAQNITLVKFSAIGRWY